jgi:hypothetical protein
MPQGAGRCEKKPPYQDRGDRCVEHYAPNGSSRQNPGSLHSEEPPFGTGDGQKLRRGGPVGQFLVRCPPLR